MSYEVKFRTRDQASVVIDNEKGEKLKALWFDENQRNTPVEIASNAYVIGDIKAIVHTPDPKIEIPNFDQTVLPEGKRCKAERSIQAAILEAAQKLGGHQSDDNPESLSWGKLITDKDWKQMIYQKLRARKGAKWCDSKTGDCACS